MHVYCDESGRVADPGRVFAVAAVLIHPLAAERALRSFRKAVEWPGEVKGHDLRDDARHTFLDIVGHTSVQAAVVVCDARTALGGWAAHVIAEAELRTQLLLEACNALAARDPVVSEASITIDGGRYPRPIREVERARLLARLSESEVRGTSSRVINYRASHDVAGLQIADVAVNTARRCLMAPQECDLPVGDQLTALPDWMSVRHLAMESNAPAWMAAPPY